ncbi:MAG: SDR family NAD(P)-dependent oxidoreductase [Proteobacteria bacterium]|nr:SDR family NAD(P)-dependent oxidoreductase [Pseudomonadota bacterium]
MKFENAKAIVSGGVSGLGFAVAERLVQAGGHVAMLDVNEDAGKAAEKKLGERALFIKTDVSNEADVNAAVEKAKAKLGSLTLAVNCAGILGAGRVLGKRGPMASDFFAKVLHVNLLGSFNLGKAAAAAMESNEPDADGQRGLIINTASVAAFEGQIGQAAYSASKGGVVSMTLPMAREFARIGVRVVAIAPGIFWTPMMEGMPPEVQESLGKQVPFPSRLGKPEEYAQVVASVYENTMINGTTIRLDGAIRMQPK